MGEIYYQIQCLSESNEEYEIQTTTTDWDEAITIRDELLSNDNVEAVKILMIEELDKVTKKNLNMHN